MTDTSGTSEARVVAIHISDGGVPKLPIPEARVGTLGLEGDRQEHTEVHGGPERAVCLFSLDLIRRLNEEGHPIRPGTTGENLTLEGVDWEAMVPGRVLEFEGGLRLEITSYANPCHLIADSFDETGSKRISQKLHPGESRVYAKVLDGASVRVDARVSVL